MAGTLAEAEHLVALARAMAPSSRSATSNASTRPCSHSDRLPIRPKYITAERLSTYTFRSTDIGVVFDLMIHDLDLLLSLIAAPVRSVAAVGVSLVRRTRGCGQRADRVRRRQRGQRDGQPGQLCGRAEDADLGAEGYASLDFAAKEATLVRPSEQLQRGRLDLDGVDLSQPAAIKDHLFGKILRVDERPRRSRASRWPSNSRTSSRRRGAESRPRVERRGCLACGPPRRPGLRSLEAHRWDAESLPAAAPTVEAPSVLRGPHSWRVRTMRQSGTGTSNR